MVKTKKSEFFQTALRPFDFDKVIERLLSKEQRFRRERSLLLEALRGWIIAPHTPSLRFNLVRIRVRRAIEQAEKKVIATEPEFRLERESEIKEKTLGKEFLNEAYYSVGGARFFRGNMNEFSVRREARKNFKKEILSLNFAFDIIHYFYLQNSKDDDETPFTLKDCYQIIDAINARARNEDIPSSANLDRILGGKSLEVKISDRRGVAGLCYAASFVEVGEDKAGNSLSLLDHFLGKKTGLRSSDVCQFLRTWLAHSAYVRDMLLDSVDSPNLAEIDDFKCLEVDPLPIPEPAFELWQVEIIERHLKRGITSP